MITDCAKKVMESGLSPKFVVCDQDPSNRSALRMLGITPDKSHFQINEHKIHMFFDTPHLMKSIRNTLSKYDIEINSDIIKWKYIEQFYKTDKEMCIKLAPKLTDSHIYFSGFEKMRVKLATQVFSRTVASALYTHSVLGALPPEAAAILQQHSFKILMNCLMYLTVVICTILGAGSVPLVIVMIT